MMKRKLCLLAILFVLIPSALNAQKESKDNAKKQIKKEISNARSNIKKGSNLENAENTMRNLLKDSANISNKNIWYTLFDAVKQQYEQLNEKLYLGQQSDTAKFFVHTLHMFDVLENLDSVNAESSKNDKSVPTYRKKHSSFLNQYRTNLFSGGGYNIQKQKYSDAYNYFKAYLDCAEQPLFEGYDYLNTDKRMVEAAYWAVFCGYKLKRPDIVDRYSELAMKNPDVHVYMLQYIAEAYNQKNDSENYCATLEKGFGQYPNNSYFFPHLVLYYANRGLHDKVLDISAIVLEAEPNNITALLARSSALFNEDKYDECVKLCDKIISIDDTKAVSYLNAGLAYYNRTIPLSSKKNLTKIEKSELIKLYKRALPYLATYRKMMPDDKKVWALPLYNIYLTLNMGDEFEEIERIIN